MTSARVVATQAGEEPPETLARGAGVLLATRHDLDQSRPQSCRPGSAVTPHPFGPTLLDMARMTVEEANAVNIVASYLAGQDEPPTMVIRALERLASRAYNRLHAGWSEDSVRRQWPAAFNEASPESTQRSGSS